MQKKETIFMVISCFASKIRPISENSKVKLEIKLTFSYGTQTTTYNTK